MKVPEGRLLSLLLLATCPTLASAGDTIHVLATNDGFEDVVLDGFDAECWVQGDKAWCGGTCAGPYTVPAGSQNVNLCYFGVGASMNSQMNALVSFTSAMGGGAPQAQLISITDPIIGPVYNAGTSFGSSFSFASTGHSNYDMVGTYTSPFTVAPLSATACQMVGITVQYAQNTVTCSGPAGTICAGNCTGRMLSCSFNLWVPIQASRTTVTVTDGTSSAEIAVAASADCPP